MIIYLCKCTLSKYNPLVRSDSKESHSIMKRIAILCLAALVAACSTTPPPAPTLAPKQVQAPAARVVPPAPPAAKAAPMMRAESPMEVFDRERARLDERSVFFDFDRSSLLPGQLSAIEDHAKLAQKFLNDQITLQGNCDERGGREYNLALGQRRADAVKERLVSLGVVASRISTVSFGKEKPRALCNEESCWSQNRRADFVDTWK